MFIRTAMFSVAFALRFSAVFRCAAAGSTSVWRGPQHYIHITLLHIHICM